MSALASRDVAAAAVAESARKGYLDGQALQGVFTWLRPNDLVWNYVVNNYLLGKEPPAFDILFWNQDTVRLAAGLHRDFINIGLDNSFTRPGALEVLGQPVDLGASRPGHLFRRRAHRSHRLLGERIQRRAAVRRQPPVRALEQRSHPSSGQPASCPGPASRASYRLADALPDTAEEFLAQAPSLSGSWWSDWERWLGGALRCAEAGAQNVGKPRSQGTGEGAGDLCSCSLTATATCRRCRRIVGGGTISASSAGSWSSAGSSSIPCSAEPAYLTAMANR